MRADLALWPLLLPGLMTAKDWGVRYAGRRI